MYRNVYNLNQLAVTKYLVRNCHYVGPIRACFKENSSLHISMVKAGLQFMNDLLDQNIFIYPAKFPNDLFCHCTNSLSSLHISIHHCICCASLHAKTSL